MRYSSSLALAAAVASFAVAGANPTLTNGAAKRFEPSTGPACHYTCPDLPGDTQGTDDGVPTPVAGTDFPTGWAYIPGGLIAEGSGNPFRALSFYAIGESGYNNFMSNGRCAAECQSRGYVLSGTQNSYECFCGNELNNGAALTRKGSSTNSCSGAPTETCGGNMVINLSFDTANAPAFVTEYLASLTSCGYTGSTAATCVYASSTGTLEPLQPATCPAEATEEGACDVKKRRFARSLTPLERKIKARQYSYPKVGPRRASTPGGPAWLKKR